jgi:hypothetical protein
VTKRFGPSQSSLEAKLKKLFFVSAREAIVIEVKRRGIAVETGFVSWYSGHMWESSKETMLRMDEALKKWETIKRERRR